MDHLEERLEELYRTRRVGYLRALATIAGGTNAANDALQEGFARALRSRKRYRGGSLEAWVWRILLRAAVDQRVRPWESIDDVDYTVQLPDAHPDVAAAVRQLPPRRRLVIFLYYYADLTYKDIAEVLDLDVGTVAATLSQGRKSLRSLLVEGTHI